MKYSYFPGCTLRTKARDLDAYARVSARALGFELEEIDNWQCCGGVYPLGSDEIATKLSSVRALNQAKEKGQDLVTGSLSVCSKKSPGMYPAGNRKDGNETGNHRLVCSSSGKRANRRCGCKATSSGYWKISNESSGLWKYVIREYPDFAE